MLLGVKLFAAFICKSAHKLCQTCTASRPRMAHRPLLLPLKGKPTRFKAQLWSAGGVGGACGEEPGGRTYSAPHTTECHHKLKPFKFSVRKTAWGFFSRKGGRTRRARYTMRISCCRQRCHQRTGEKRARCAGPHSNKRLVETRCSLIEKKQVSRLAVAERLLLNSPHLLNESKRSEIYVQMWATRMRAVKQVFSAC